MSAKQQHLIRGGIGASLLGFGWCALIESGFLKHEGAETLVWVAAGTGSLVVSMAGLCILIDALRFRIRMDQKNEVKT
jgi:hypothetical protein